MFGSRTYTSPASFESESVTKHAKSKCTMRSKNIDQIKVREKFSMLRGIIENVDDPNKRKILLNFLDQSTIQTEYVTVKESSMTSENVDRIDRVISKCKRRRKSPGSVAPKFKQHRHQANLYPYMPKRKRFSCSRGRVNTEMAHEHIMQSIVIERKNGSDGFNSKNGDNCFTEESKEVPLEDVLYKFDDFNFSPPLRIKPDRISGYSASQDEPTRGGDYPRSSEEFKYDLEAGVVLSKHSKSKGKTKGNKDTPLSQNLIDTQSTSSLSIDAIKLIKQWSSWIKTIVIACLILTVIAIATRGIVLEIRQSTYKTKISTLNAKVDNLEVINQQWKDFYDK
jgi:hypothetical protein